jgi:hypothetical protein
MAIAPYQAKGHNIIGKFLTFKVSMFMDKLKLTGLNLGRVFNTRRVCMDMMELLNRKA